MSGPRARASRRRTGLEARNPGSRYAVETCAPKRQGPIGWLMSRRRRWLWIAAALLIGYPLSIGPVILLWGLLGRPGWFEDPAALFYRPVLWMGEFVPVVEWYTDLWNG